MTRDTWLPNFFVAGAPKAGTSSLHQWIADHPDAFGSEEKETYFFVDPGTHMYRPDAHISKGLDSWRAQFPIPEGVQPKVIVESTPAYIYSQTALREIPALPSQPKCLFVLRDPASQVYSLYTYFRDNWTWIPSDMSFDDFLNAVREGSHDFGGNELAQNALANAAYVDVLLPWLEALGPDRIMVTTFDELLRDQRALTKRVAAWIGLDPSFYDEYEFPRENETYVPKNRALQRLNVGIRGALPKGKLYEAARSVYRRLNTTKPTGPTDRDSEVLEALKREFHSANTRLEQAFDLNLSAWNAESDVMPKI